MSKTRGESPKAHHANAFHIKQNQATRTAQDIRTWHHWRSIEVKKNATSVKIQDRQGALIAKVVCGGGAKPEGSVIQNIL